MKYESLVYKIKDNQITILSCEKNVENVTIPPEIDGLPVTHIASDTFSGCSELKFIEIPNSVTNIGKKAFASCYSLKSIIIPDSVVEMGHSCFYNCYNLESLIIPSKVTHIQDWFFYGCSELKTLTIPDSVTKIGDYALIGNTNLRYIKCNPDSYAEQWACKNGIKTLSMMSELQQLLDRTSSPTLSTNHSDLFSERSDHNEI